MFYTLVSRSFITNINCSRDYMNIFLIGSVGYIILHWYLYSEKKEGITEKIREYLYYMMVIDIVTSYVLVTFYPSKSSKHIDNSDEQKNIAHSPSQSQPSPEERQLMMQRMQNMKRLQQQKIKESMQKENDVTGEREQGSPEQKSNPSTPVNNETPNSSDQQDQGPNSASSLDKKIKEDEEKQPKKSIFSKSEESRDELDTKESDKSKKSYDAQAKTDIKIKKKDTEVSDTELPIFDGTKNNSTKN